jgi:hypothetical protein
MSIRSFLAVAIAMTAPVIYDKPFAQTIPEYGMSILEIAEIRIARDEPVWIYSPLTRECSRVKQVSVSKPARGTNIRLKTGHSEHELYFETHGKTARTWWILSETDNRSRPQALKALADYNFRFDLTRSAQNRLPKHLRNEILYLYFSSERICVTGEEQMFHSSSCKANTDHTLLIAINSIPYVSDQSTLLFNECKQ